MQWVNAGCLRRRIVLAIFCLHVVCYAAYAAGPPGFTRKVWQNQDGLPEQTVQAFAQTADRYLWIGTTGGLLRFDGAQFTLFDRDNTPELKENSVFALLVSRDGSLWIGTEGGGLTRYRDGRFQSYGAADGLSDGFVRALKEDRNGTLWVGTDNGLLRMSGGKLQRVDGMGKTPALAVHAIAEDHLGGLWVGGSRVLRLDHGSAREYHIEGSGSQNRVKSILETADHTVWVGTVSGLHRLDKGAKNFKRLDEVKGTVRVLQQTSDGTLWVGTIGQGVLSIRGEKSIAMSAPNELPSNAVLNLFEDGEKNIWIGTQAGMLRLTGTPARVMLLPQASDSDFGTISTDRDGALWIVTAGVFHMRDGVIQPYTFPGLEHIPVRNIFRDRSGALWIGTDGNGVVRMDGGKALWLTTRQGLVNNFIRAIEQSRDGSVWIATDEGVSHWAAGSFHNYQMRDGLSYFSTRVLLEDRSGDLWIGTDRGLSQLRNGVFVHDEATDGLSQKKVWAIHEDADGGLWFGTRNDGLYRWKQGKLTHYTTEQGLESNSIYQILDAANGGFWMSGPNGISLLSRRDLDAVADHPGQYLPLTFYGLSDEVETTQIYGGRQPSGCLDANGDAWFPSDRGPIHILRNAMQTASLPPVRISEVLVNGRPVPVNQPIVMAPGNARLELQYAPILLRSQDGVRFRYKLDGFDANWIDASTRRVASYTNLPPGTFTFHVAAFEVNNPQAISEASLEITQTPRFYRTLWFVVLCILVIAMLIFGVYRFRLWQMKMRYEAVLEERGRLAREMHDTVIQGCTSISALLEAMTSVGQPGDSLTNELMEHARTQVGTTIDEARHAVWNLRQQRPSENSIGEALKGLAEQISKEFGIAVTCELTGKPFVLNQFATHELLMMAREAVFNAVLHAKPARIDISVRFAKKDVTLEIRDDGLGFDPSQIRADEEHHFGLVGMRERVQSVGGRFHLESAVGRGTRVRIQIPRRVSAPQSEMLSV